ncbi:S-adenosyl-L-methionine-dependent methyltransferase [Kalaharituber pfeilii]|nr:S-adenosyl-L-methionine-dependent methyltransferase [Kalaharituber pfeilii]
MAVANYNYTVALSTPRHFVKRAKRALEKEGLFAKKIERLNGGGDAVVIRVAFDDGGGGGKVSANCSGGGGGEERYLVYTSFKVTRGGDNGRDEEDAVEDDGEDVAVLERLGHDVREMLLVENGDHVEVVYVRDDVGGAGTTATSLGATTTTATSTTAQRVRNAIRAFLAEHWGDVIANTKRNTNTNDGGLGHKVDVDIPTLLDTLPKRWSYYSPMILLPPTAFSHAQWKAYLSRLPPQLESTFYALLTTTIHSSATHLAINAPIPLVDPSATASSPTQNNLRKPTNLIPLRGTFDNPPLFVTCTQNSLHQTWSPLHTMFSRGNITEKLRIRSPTFPGAFQIPGSAICDLYAGIGYFVFPYLAAGAKRLFAWEINEWSVKGLVRGAGMNGWRAMVVKEGEQTPSREEIEGVEIVVFLEDNRFARRRMMEVKEVGGIEGSPVRHVNLGLLPSSVGAWDTAAGILKDGAAGEGGWAHVHENVGNENVEEKRKEVVEGFEGWAREEQKEGKGKEMKVKCENVFKVKTYAPGVVHCVFDVRVYPERNKACISD